MKLSQLYENKEHKLGPAKPCEFYLIFLSYQATMRRKEKNNHSMLGVEREKKGHSSLSFTSSALGVGALSAG